MLLAFMRWGGRAAGVRSLCDWRGAFDGRPGGFDGRCGAFDGRRPWLGVFGSGRGGGSRRRPVPGSCTIARPCDRRDLDRWSTAQAEWNRSPGRHYRSSRQHLFAGSAFAARYASNREGAGEGGRRQGHDEDKRAGADAGSPPARVGQPPRYARRAHQDGQAIGDAPVAARHVSSREGNLP